MCADSRRSPVHAQDLRGSTLKPPFPHARWAIDPVSSMVHPSSARAAVSRCARFRAVGCMRTECTVGASLPCLVAR